MQGEGLRVSTIQPTGAITRRLWRLGESEMMANTSMRSAKERGGVCMALQMRLVGGEFVNGWATTWQPPKISTGNLQRCTRIPISFDALSTPLYRASGWGSRSCKGMRPRAARSTTISECLLDCGYSREICSSTPIWCTGATSSLIIKHALQMANNPQDSLSGLRRLPCLCVSCMASYFTNRKG